MRWVNEEKARYYQAWLIEDLFGDWTLVTAWGGLGSRRGRARSPCLFKRTVWRASRRSPSAVVNVGITAPRPLDPRWSVERSRAQGGSAETAASRG